MLSAPYILYQFLLTYYQILRCLVHNGMFLLQFTIIPIMGNFNVVILGKNFYKFYIIFHFKIYKNAIVQTYSYQLCSTQVVYHKSKQKCTKHKLLNIFQLYLQSRFYRPLFSQLFLPIIQFFLFYAAVFVSYTRVFTFIFLNFYLK